MPAGSNPNSHVLILIHPVLFREKIRSDSIQQQNLAGDYQSLDRLPGSLASWIKADRLLVQYFATAAVRKQRLPVDVTVEYQPVPIM
jgi:hypothetical protein